MTADAQDRGSSDHAREPDIAAQGGGMTLRSGRIGVVPYSEIRREAVEWLVPGRVPLGAVSILAGEPGLGKSLYTVQLAAGLSRQGHSSILLSAEDSEGATIRPRLDACQANVRLVHSVRLLDADSGDGLALPADVDELDRLVDETKAALVVIDPIVAYLDGGIDSHKDASVRQALAPLARVAASRRCAVLAVLHVNKAIGSDWYRRLSGSGGFGGAARSVLLFGRNPDDAEPDRGTGRLLAHAKCNVSNLAPSEAWTVAPVVLPADGGQPAATTARLDLVGESEHGYRSLLDETTNPDERLPREEAEEFLRVELAAGPRPAKDVQQAARNAGISPRTLTRAKATLGVASEKVGGSLPGAHWTWALSKDATPSESAQLSAAWPTSPEASDHADSAPSENLPDGQGGHVPDVALFDPASIRGDVDSDEPRRTPDGVDRDNDGA